MSRQALFEGARPLAKLYFLAAKNSFHWQNFLRPPYLKHFPVSQLPRRRMQPPPPPIATRPEKTKSIYTKPIDEDEDDTPSLKIPPTVNENELTGQQPAVKSNNNVNNNHKPAHNERPKKKKMSDEEILSRLRQIVTVGDPNRKYTKMEKIGQGASGTVFTAIETATGMEVAIKQMNL